MNIKHTWLAVLFLPFCFSQSGKAQELVQPVFQDSIPGTSFFLKDRNIVYQKVFTSQLKQDALNEKMNSLLSTMKSFRFTGNGPFLESEFYGRLFSYHIDAKRYDYSRLNVTGTIIIPIRAVIAIQVKDYKYRVTITDINFMNSDHEEHLDLRLDDLIAEKNRVKIKQRKPVIKLAQYLDQEFSILFDLNRSIIAADF